ncbi:MAG: ribosome biosis GTP-binding protein YlqF [Cyanobacteria bacterium RYN_339]|nr:ribosome biosis GTP-binding protein YlqF [Cyanobacteria bacterium RYN_339]
MSLINWYPGHIAKAQNTLKEQLKLIDFVLELVDARLPQGSRFDVTNTLLGNKPRVLVFTKGDMADARRMNAWVAHYRKAGMAAVSLNAQTGQGLPGLKTLLQKQGEVVRARMVARGRLPRASRVMVVGLPNVGKSSLINKLVNKRRVKIGDKPGVTRNVSWIRLGSNLELMDTPGIIPPKLDDQDLALALAMIGAVSTEAYDPIVIVPEVITILNREAPHIMAAFPDQSLEGIARQRGAMGPGGAPDVERAARQFMYDLRTGALGKLTLDAPPVQFDALEEITDELDEVPLGIVADVPAEDVAE